VLNIQRASNAGGQFSNDEPIGLDAEVQTLVSEGQVPTLEKILAAFIFGTARHGLVHPDNPHSALSTQGGAVPESQGTQYYRSLRSVPTCQLPKGSSIPQISPLTRIFIKEILWGRDKLTLAEHVRLEEARKQSTVLSGTDAALNGGIKTEFELTQALAAGKIPQNKVAHATELLGDLRSDIHDLALRISRYSSYEARVCSDNKPSVSEIRLKAAIQKLSEKFLCLSIAVIRLQIATLIFPAAKERKNSMAS
jgi:hypothetical protein